MHKLVEKVEQLSDSRRQWGNEWHKLADVVSANVAESQIMFGQLVTEEKSNEITTVPELSDVLNVKGAWKLVSAQKTLC